MGFQPGVQIGRAIVASGQNVEDAALGGNDGKGAAVVGQQVRQRLTGTVIGKKSAGLFHRHGFQFVLQLLQFQFHFPVLFGFQLLF